MEKLRKLYSKDINRDIQGVIKVDDESYISQELEEYVVTDELLKHFKSFFEAYDSSINSNTEKMGVWISGFFGSGKSHFLKIISYLLENRVVNDKHAVDYFNDKIKDKKLLSEIKEAGSVPTDVLLFNIDSKTENINGNKDKILDVFEKVFNEKLGLSITPFVAEIERFIIKQNKYEEFKKEFENVCGSSWESMRDGIQFVQDEFSQAYSKVLGKSQEEANEIIDRTEKNYSLSVEKFAQRIRNYLEDKKDNHRVIFLVDEIGQYIGDDKSLMLNLQTIVEDLGIECGGRVWVIVTSQEAIDDVVKVQGNDFSKIQGRFDTKLSLSSSDIDEVIKKRILDKTPEAFNTLELMYDKDKSSIINLLTFTNTSYQKIYEDSKDFAQTYPFIPYQFRLLQEVFTDIRKRGFAGKHLSSGERSLLGGFQTTAKSYGDFELGTLIPFYAFYDTIEQFLDHQIKIVIKTAVDTVESGELEEYDVDVLKMLFMLKNIKEIPCNIDNLSTLYVSNIKDDKKTIKDKISESLKRLEAQTLIQRNNDEYKFLTDEEQEINREIKQIVVDQNKITEYLKKIVFGEVYTDNKFTYNNKPFTLTKYVDNIKYSQENEIGIKVISSIMGLDDSEIISQSINENKYIYVKLVISSSIYDEIINFLQIEEFVRKNDNNSNSAQVQEILNVKKREMNNTETLLKLSINEELNNSEIIYAGDRLRLNSKEIKSRINEALIILINSIYNRFNYINYNYNKDDIRELFHDKTVGITIETQEFVNQKAYDAMKEYIEERNEYSIPTTVRTLLQDFEKAPYGFLEEDILYILTKLLKDEVITLVYINEVLNITMDDTLNKILKREYYDKTTIKIRKKISIELINNLKSVARTSFNYTNLRDDEDGMVEDFRIECLKDTQNRLDKILNNYGYYNNSKYQYPGEDESNSYKELIDKLLKIKDIEELFNYVNDNKEEINRLSKEFEFVEDFFNGSQKVQFDEARKILLIYYNNKDYTDDTEELNNIVGKMNSILTNKEPYSEIHKLPMLRKDLIEILGNMYENKSKPIIDMINNNIDYINKECDTNKVDKEFCKYYIDSFNNIINKINNSHELKDIYAQKSIIEDLLDKFVYDLEIEKNKLNKDVKEDKEEIKENKIIKVNELMNPYYIINNKEDIDNYLNELKDKLLKELNDNNNLIIK